MTDEERKQKLDAFLQSKKAEEDEMDDPWTEEAILIVAKRIIERMGLDGELQ